jgi:hypothetical protein
VDCRIEQLPGSFLSDFGGLVLWLGLFADQAIEHIGQQLQEGLRLVEAFKRIWGWCVVRVLASSLLVIGVILNRLHQEMPRQVRRRDVHLPGKLLDRLALCRCQPHAEDVLPLRLRLWWCYLLTHCITSRSTNVFSVSHSPRATCEILQFGLAVLPIWRGNISVCRFCGKFRMSITIHDLLFYVDVLSISKPDS